MLPKNTDGALGSQLHTPPWNSLGVEVVFPREMKYLWTIGPARAEGLRVRRDGINGVLTPSLEHAPEHSVT